MNPNGKVVKTLRVLISLLVCFGILAWPQINTQATTGQQPSSQGLYETTQTLISKGASWKYLDNGSDQGTAWTSAGFDDSKWKSGAAELGYGDGDEKTVVSYGSNSKAKYITTYFRQLVTIENAASVTSLLVDLTRDDGAIMYINGKEVIRSNMPTGTVTYKTVASKATTDPTVTWKIPSAALTSGVNAITVEIHQSSGSSSDISFDMKLVANVTSSPAPTAQPTVAPTTPAQPTAQPTVNPTTPPTAQPTVQPTVQPSAQPTVQPTAPPPTTSTGKSWYVAPNGSTSGSGSTSSPWSLAKALSHPSGVQPGDTIWVRGGTYGSGGDNPFESNLTGADGKYITVRAYPGEKAVINGGVFIKKPYSIFWGFEVLNTNTNRTTSASGSFADDGRSDGFGVYASYTKLINNVIHDTNGIGAWESAVNVELYGNVVYNSGWKGSDRGHGHGLYMQNDSGTKTVVDNVIANNFSGYNIHVYTESAHIQGFYLEGNVSINGDILVAGLQPAARINLTGNTSYNGFARFGYNNSVTNVDLTLKNNTFYGPGDNAVEVNRWKSLNVSGNTLWSTSMKDVYYTSLSSHDTYAWNNNAYFAGGSSPFSVNGSSKSWDSWKSATGFDGASSFKGSQPTGVKVVVRPNKYESKRANILVYNWDKQGSVTVDLSSTGLQPGDTYVLHNTLNWNETVTGTYNGSPISLSMTSWSVAKPTGYSSTLGPSPFPMFGAFVLSTK